MNNFTLEQKISFFDNLYELTKITNNKSAIKDFVIDEFNKLDLKLIHESNPKFLTKSYYVILNYNTYHSHFTNNELLHDTYSNASVRINSLIKEYDLCETDLLLIGPLSSKEKAEDLFTKASDKKRRRGYYLFVSDSSYLVEFGTLKENYIKLKITDSNINDFEFFGPFKREWEAYDCLNKIE